MCDCVCFGVKRSDTVLWPFGALSEVFQIEGRAGL